MDTAAATDRRARKSTSGDVIREARERQNWSKQACARELGISRQQLHSYETDRARPSHSRVLRAFADVLGVSPAQLFADF